MYPANRQGETRPWPWGEDEGAAEAGPRGWADAEIRGALGLESAFGFHIEGDDGRGEGTDELLPLLDAPSGSPGASSETPYPCLHGHDYRGCLGLACPLEICWTGAATISFARKQRERSRVSTALYLPGAPCQSCAHLAEDEVTVPAPRALGQPRQAPQRGDAARAREETPPPGEQAVGRLRRVACDQGLWAHPVSLSSFLLKRIPMLDQVEPEQCPGYQPRAEPHPEVLAHLRRRRERARQRREERRASGDV